MALLKYCNRNGCNKLVPQGVRYCKAHTVNKTAENRERHKEYDAHCRNQTAKAFYNSSEWKTTRARVLARDTGIDIYLYITEGRVVPADTVHHIVELMMYGGEIEIKDLWIMPSADTTIVIDDKGVFGDSGDIYYWYTDKYSGESYIFPSGDVLHFKTSMTFDGYSGAPVREILKATIEGGLESQNFLNNLYKGGLTARAVLQYTGDMSPKLEKALIARLEEYANGANNAGKFIPIPIGMKIEPLNIKLTDSQFFELKKYSALQIAGAFGIKPNQINDYEKSSYANSEMQNISFYIDTELFILKQYEEELDYKLLEPSDRRQGKYYKFNENVILRTDAKSQATILTGYVQNGIYTPNEARSYMNKPRKEGGDELICNGNYIKVAQIGIEEKKEGGGDNG